MPEQDSLAQDVPIRSLYPLRFIPVCRDHPWGGYRLAEAYGRGSSGCRIAESWEIADRDDGMSVIANGPLAGRSLNAVSKEHMKAILGSAVTGDRFPLLIKLIDARENLSVQVHPGEAAAELLGGEAKSEFWYVLESDNANVWCGFNQVLSKRDFAHAVEAGRCLDHLRVVPVQRHSAVMVEAGTVHAIGEGCLLLEIQQNSDTTFRLYDWDRVDESGQPRPLHVDHALKAIDWGRNSQPVLQPVMLGESEGGSHGRYLSGNPFCVDRYLIHDEVRIPMSGKSFHALFIVEGEVRMDWSHGSDVLVAGSCTLVPAALGDYALNGRATAIRISMVA